MASQVDFDPDIALKSITGPFLIFTIVKMKRPNKNLWYLKLPTFWDSFPVGYRPCTIQLVNNSQIGTPTSQSLVYTWCPNLTGLFFRVRFFIDLTSCCFKFNFFYRTEINKRIFPCWVNCSLFVMISHLAIQKRFSRTWQSCLVWWHWKQEQL